MNKKIALFLTIFISFLFVGQVNAETYSSFEEEAKNVGITFRCDSENDILYINDKPTNTSCNQFNTTNYDDLYYYVFKKIIIVSDKKLVYAMGNYGSSYHSYGFYRVPGTTSAVFNYFSDNNGYFSRTGYGVNNGTTADKYYGTDKQKLAYLYTNTDVYKYDSSKENYYDSNVVVFENQVVNTIPTISITKESENKVTILDKEYITDITMKIDFSLIDNEKYLYMYKYGSESEWETITLTESTSISKTFSENNTLYVRVKDRTTNEFVAESTLTISSINYDKITPYLEITEKEDTNCIYNNSTICKILSVNTHIVDFEKYSLWYKEPGQDMFYKFDSYSASSDNTIVNFDVYKNGTYYFKIINNEDNTIVDFKELPITDISESDDTVEKKIYISKKYWYRTNVEFNLRVVFKIMNYSLNNYDIYLRENDSEFTLINNSISQMNQVLYEFERSTNKNTIYYIKVTDKDGNYVQSYTFSIDYDTEYKKWLDENQPEDIGFIQDFVNNHIFSKLKFISQLKTIYDSIFLYDIQEGTDAPSFTFDLSFIHMKPVTVVMEIDYKIRSQIHGYIKVFATLSVIFTFIKQLAKFWSH